MEQLVARWAHNPKVARSSRVPATLKENQEIGSPFFLFSAIDLSWLTSILGLTLNFCGDYFSGKYLSYSIQKKASVCHSS